MRAITAILVDDEDFNLKGLRQKIETQFSEIEIIGCYQQPEKAIEAIKANPPDILFLDIQMPRINGFELLSMLTDIKFQIIFVTAYSEYAIEAFKKSATDYILKPIDDTDLKKAITSALTAVKLKIHHAHNSKLVELLSNNIAHNDKLIVPTATGISFIPQNDIYHVEGYDGYTKIHSKTGAFFTSSYSLGKFEKLLNDNFFRCHKSHIINIDEVRSFENEGYLILLNEAKVPISKANKEAFLNMFS